MDPQVQARSHDFLRAVMTDAGHSLPDCQLTELAIWIAVSRTWRISQTWVITP
jgi:hypothetical protein